MIKLWWKHSKQIYQMPKICWSTLNAFRKKTSQFNPKRPGWFCINHSGQNWVQVLDSNKVLPDRWKDIMLGEFLADNPVANCMGNYNNFGLSSDGSWWSTSVSCMVSPHDWSLISGWGSYFNTDLYSWLFPPKGWRSSEKPTAKHKSRRKQV